MSVDRLDNDGLLFDEFKISFDATSSSVVSTTTETITHTNHGFVTGDPVKYFVGVSGSAIGGLVNGTEYFVIRMDNNILKLSSSYSNAVSGTPIDITSVASAGTAHILTKSNSILFKVFEGNYPVGSIYANKSSSANPNTYLSGGGHAVWSSIVGRVIVGVGAGSDGTDSVNFSEDEDIDQSYRDKIYWFSWCISLLISVCNGLMQLLSLSKQYSSYILVREKLIAEGWKYLKGYRIHQAVPSCLTPPSSKPALTEVYRCGDYFGLPSIDSAMKSGRLTAEHIIREFQF